MRHRTYLVLARSVIKYAASMPGPSSVGASMPSLPSAPSMRTSPPPAPLAPVSPLPRGAPPVMPAVTPLQTPAASSIVPAGAPLPTPQMAGATPGADGPESTLYQSYEGGGFDPNSAADRYHMQQLMAASAGGPRDMEMAAARPYLRKAAAVIAIMLPTAKSWCYGN